MCVSGDVYRSRKAGRKQQGLGQRRCSNMVISFNSKDLFLEKHNVFYDFKRCCITKIPGFVPTFHKDKYAPQRYARVNKGK